LRDPFLFRNLAEALSRFNFQDGDEIRGADKRHKRNSACGIGHGVWPVQPILHNYKSAVNGGKGYQGVIEEIENGLSSAHAF